MKFAKQLALRSIPSWAPYYLDYKSLKQFIKSSFKDVAGKYSSSTFACTSFDTMPSSGLT